VKIALLTMTFNNNYGGYLQAYSLMETLKKLGHQPELLFVQLDEKKFKSQFKKYIKKYFLSYFFHRWENERIKKVLEKNTNYFSDKYILPRTKKIFNEKDFNKIIENNYDAYIIGSDQVWRPTMYKYIDQAFFGFVKNSNTILLSYAASFGLDKWEYTDAQTKRFKKDIEKFKAISVREDSGIKLCEEYFSVEAKHVLDPTMLLDVKDYRKIIKQENEPSFKNGLLTYILDKSEDKLYLENMIAEEFGLESYAVNVKSKDVNAKLEDKIYPTVTSWLKGFDDAKFVVTDSFHGCVFAIIFNKPFIVYGNERRGMARFHSLLKKFGIEDRLVINRNSITRNKIKGEIDWKKVNIKLKHHINFSKKYLKDNLRHENLNE
jgi:exopolysaccharide biosynthesis predicted pyruvyltransferase EpsI